MEAKFGENEDRISQLPTELIHKILSGMDTKYAVQTCVLSKRWELVWKSLPHLKFDRGLFHFHGIFIMFVVNVLFGRHMNAGVSTITYVSNPICTPLTRMIISYATSRNAEQLTIVGGQFPMLDWFSFPPLDFFSLHLKKLSLRVNIGIFDDSLNFPSLTSLDLENAHFIFLPDENPMKPAYPFSQLVSLKELVLDNCLFWGANVIGIASPGLEKLTISVTTRVESSFTLSTPNLSSFTYKGNVPLSISVNDLRCLDHLEIDIRCSLSDMKFFKNMDAMFRQLSCTRSLTVSFNVLRVLHCVPQVISRGHSPFCNLERLKIVNKPHSVSMACIDAVLYLLNRSPNARVLVRTEETHE